MCGQEQSHSNTALGDDINPLRQVPTLVKLFLISFCSRFENFSARMRLSISWVYWPRECLMRVVMYIGLVLNITQSEFGTLNITKPSSFTIKQTKVF